MAIRSFPPIVGENCRVLVLGSMPGVASLEAGFYYAHRRNAFWPIMGELFGSYPKEIELRYRWLAEKGIALWDVLESCEREGSLDSGICQGVPNDIEGLLAGCPKITHVFCNGGAAYNMYKRYFGALAPEAIRLPSTSPAAASYTFEQKLTQWRKILEVLT